MTGTNGQGASGPPAPEVGQRSCFVSYPNVPEAMSALVRVMLYSPVPCTVAGIFAHRPDGESLTFPASVLGDVTVYYVLDGKLWGFGLLPANANPCR